MPFYADDFLDVLDREVADARADLVRRVDRTDALVALRSRALDLSAVLNRPISIQDLKAQVKDEHDRALLFSLFDRILDEGGNRPEGALRDGYRLETGAQS